MAIHDSLDNILKLALRVFPVSLPTFAWDDEYMEFGDRAVSDITMVDDDGGNRIELVYDDTARWLFWEHPRFRTDNDAVEFKLRFG